MTRPELPVALRDALEEPTVIAGIPMTLDHATQEYGRRCMAAALRWGAPCRCEYVDPPPCSACEVIAALEQEAT